MQTLSIALSLSALVDPPPEGDQVLWAFDSFLREDSVEARTIRSLLSGLLQQSLAHSAEIAIYRQTPLGEEKPDLLRLGEFRVRGLTLEVEEEGEIPI